MDSIYMILSAICGGLILILYILPHILPRCGSALRLLGSVLHAPLLALLLFGGAELSHIVLVFVASVFLSTLSGYVGYLRYARRVRTVSAVSDGESSDGGEAAAVTEPCDNGDGESSEGGETSGGDGL